MAGRSLSARRRDPGALAGGAGAARYRLLRQLALRGQRLARGRRRGPGQVLRPGAALLQRGASGR